MNYVFKICFPSAIFLTLSSSCFISLYISSLLPFPPPPPPPPPPPAPLLCTVSVYVNPILVQLCCEF